MPETAMSETAIRLLPYAPPLRGLGVLREAPTETPQVGAPWTYRAYDVAGVGDTVKLVAQQIREGSESPVIRQLLSQLLTGRSAAQWDVPEKNDRAEIEKVFSFVRDNIRYTGDITTVETLQRAERTLQLKIADCDDQVILAGALLRAAGFSVALKVVAVASDEYEHIYLLIGLPRAAPSQWLAFDTTEKQPLGWEVPAKRVRRSKTYAVDDLKPSSDSEIIGGDAVTENPRGHWVWAVLSLFAIAKWLQWA